LRLLRFIARGRRVQVERARVDLVRRKLRATVSIETREVLGPPLEVQLAIDLRQRRLQHVQPCIAALYADAGLSDVRAPQKITPARGRSSPSAGV
jgi:hypothetical protein